MLDSFQEITAKLTALKFDSADYVCLKFILLLNAGKRTETRTTGDTFVFFPDFQIEGTKNSTEF